MFKNTTLTDEQQLVQALQNGDEKAVAVWFKTYQARLTAYVGRKLDHPADVEELVQEVFINCLRNVARFKFQSSLYTWMCSIANHEVADYFRRRYAKKFIHTLPLVDFLFHDELKVEDAHETAESLDRVFKKIGARAKELLFLKYVDRRRTAEIADLYGKTDKAIESELFRARRDFKDAYQEAEAAKKTTS